MTINDLIGRNEDILQLTAVLEEEYKFEDEAYVLGLNAKYGDGKTWFLKSWQDHLSEKGHEVIYIDTWKHDFTENPLFSLCYELSTFFEPQDKNAIKDNEYEQKKEEKKGKIVSNLKKVAAYSTIFTSQIVTHVTGVDAIEAQKLIDDINSETIPDTEFKISRERILSMDALRTSLENYVASLDGKPLFIFVDELDRAKPDYAIKFLEIIKHVFPVKGIIFVIATDENQLESMTKKIYGQNTEFQGYYRKFISTVYNLPSIYTASEYENDKIKKYVNGLYEKHVKELGRKTSLKDDSYYKSRLETIESMLEIFKLSLRDINYFFRILMRYLSTQESNRTAIFGYVDTASFLIALKIAKKDDYEKLFNNISTMEEVLEFIDKCNLNNYNKRTILLSLLSNKNKEESNIIKLKLIEEELTESEEKTLSWYNSSFSDFSGYLNTPPISSIYKKLESLSKLFS